ncbi:FMN-binding protein [Raoultibacter timonensis]|uniref:FMN-binding protein n=1 Tax=Raoultibacter timonensis TaxID=1907662 RepID=UPI0026DB8F02|nr:FMN-binding protein [Raoultibacter timonensis]
MKRTTILACGAVLTLGLSGCGATFEGSGSKDAASAEQLAMRADDPWAREAAANPSAKAAGNLHDGVYVGTGKGMEGLITVSLLVDDGRIACLEITQEGESQSRGGFEAIRDGRFAAMIDAAQGSDIDAISGATITTAGVRQAIDDALAQAETGIAVTSAAEASADKGASPKATASDGEAVAGEADAVESGEQTNGIEGSDR